METLFQTVAIGCAGRDAIRVESRTLKEESQMPNPEGEKAWNRFESDIQGLASELKRHYRNAADEKNAADLNRSLEQLRQAADAVFKSLDTATRDPEVRTKTKQTARSFGLALAETFRELSDEIEKAVRRPAETKK